MELTTNSSHETQRFGENFAKKLRGGEVLALVGELGSGKTTFVQGLARGLGIKQRIISPTFIIMRQYQIPASHLKLPTSSFYHVDLYRLEDNLVNEIKNLGLYEVWGRPDTIVAIEWAEKIRDLLPQSAVWINFSAVDNNTRHIRYIDICYK